MTRTISLLVIAGFTALALTAAAGAAGAQEVTTAYPVAVVCVPGGSDPQLCEPPFTVPVVTTGTLAADFTASPGHCSDIRVRFLVDGAPVTDFSEPLSAGESTGEIDLGPVSAGPHTVGVQALGVVGGCNTGALHSWGGTLEVTTSFLVGPPTTKDQFKNDGWRAFNNPVFENQGDCVSFVATGGRNPGQ